MKSKSPGEPRSFFARDQWPHGAPLEADTPKEVLYAAELANFVRTLAYEQAPVLSTGLGLLAKEVGVSLSTLRYISEGSGWTSIMVMARLESFAQKQGTGWSLVAQRIVRGRTEKPATAPVKAPTVPKASTRPAVAAAERRTGGAAGRAASSRARARR